MICTSSQTQSHKELEIQSLKEVITFPVLELRKWIVGFGFIVTEKIWAFRIDA